MEKTKESNSCGIVFSSYCTIRQHCYEAKVLAVLGSSFVVPRKMEVLLSTDSWLHHRETPPANLRFNTRVRIRSVLVPVWKSIFPTCGSACDQPTCLRAKKIRSNREQGFSYSQLCIAVRSSSRWPSSPQTLGSSMHFLQGQSMSRFFGIQSRVVRTNF